MMEREPAGRVLVPGPVGWWDSRAGSSPQVLRLPGGRWRMYYYGRDVDFPKDVGLPSGRVGVAESADGVHWEKVSGPLTMGAVLEPHPDQRRFDCTHVGVTDVHYRDGLFWLWYYGGDNQTGESADQHQVMRGLRMRPGLAVSRDGFHFVRVPGPYQGAILDYGAPAEWDHFFVSWPHVEEPLGPGDPWRLYYHSRNPATKEFRAGLATSPDGLHWEKWGPVLGPGPAGSWNEAGPSCRSVFRANGRWAMLFEASGFRGRFQIGLAWSDDGVAWEAEPEPVFSPGEDGTWDDGATGTPCVVPMDGGGWRLYYIGVNRTSPERPFAPAIGLAESDGDLRRWRRVQV